MNTQKLSRLIVAMSLVSSCGIFATNYRIEGPGAKALSELGIEGCMENVCEFDQPELIDIGAKEVASIETMDDTVKVVGNSAAYFDNDKDEFRYLYFADLISGVIKNNMNDFHSDAISCETEMTPFPCPLPAYHHITTCTITATLKR